MRTNLAQTLRLGPGPEAQPAVSCTTTPVTSQRNTAPRLASNHYQDPTVQQPLLAPMQVNACSLHNSAGR
jgi:hypothetical protein